MKQARIHSFVLFLLLAIWGFPAGNSEASCGSSSCFLNIGNQPSVQPKDVVLVDIAYSYVPQSGPNNRVAAVNLENQEQILNEHQEFQTINQRLNMNLNYGLTDNITLQSARWNPPAPSGGMKSR